MITYISLIEDARRHRASDIHLSEGSPIRYRIDGELQMAEVNPSDAELKAFITSLLSDQQKECLYHEDMDFAMEDEKGNRQRVNVYYQQGRLAATIRLLNAEIPDIQKLGLPEVLLKLADEPRGLILITGPTGSGKTTTLASMLNYINETRREHIITIEDPIEYVYREKNALIHQREVGKDVPSFSSALRSSLREDPDVILVGEMRDYETISAALTAAETGHLVLSTLHTFSAAQTVDRIIDVCPPASQAQVRTQLAGVLKGVVTQCLLPRVDGEGRVVATEVLLGNEAVLSNIRESKTHQLPAMMQSGRALGMHTLNNDLVRLCREGLITKDVAYRYSNDKKEIAELLYE